MVRLFAAAFLAVVMPVCGMTASAQTSPTTPSPTSPAAPTRIISVYGDSLADGVWSGLYDLTKADPQTKLLRHSQIGTRLTRPDFPTWQAEVKAQLDEDKPTVAVVLFGLNDMTGLRDEERKGYLYKTPGWEVVYKQRAEWLLTQFNDHKTKVVWLGLPVMRKAELDEHAKYVSAMFKETATRMNATFLSLYQDYADKDGGFQSHVEDDKKRSRQLRADDGVHFTGYGYSLLGNKVLTRIKELEQATAAATPVKTQ